ncbi:hypothetical protein P7C71_g6384, partial [Lecanoromycetidae sp. Uapishka_2]
MKTAGLTKLAQKLIIEGPHKIEKTSRRVRGLFDGRYVFDTTAASHVWEHPYYPQFYVPISSINSSQLRKDEAVDEDKSAFLATLKGNSKVTDQVISFEKGPLAGLLRIEFGSLDQWFEEDMPIYGHPKDPYKRIEILPSSRTVTIKVDGVTIAESSNNLFLLETMLRMRYYMPKTAHKDLVWWYKYPTAESAPIDGHLCFYNEKVEVYIDGVKEET